MIDPSRQLLMLVAGCALSLSLSGCYYDIEEELYPAACDTGNVTWTQHIEPLMQSTCAISGCHVPGGTGPGDLSGYPGVKAAADNGTLRAVLIELKVMPPSGPLSGCNMDRVDAWLQNGAPQD